MDQKEHVGGARHVVSRTVGPGQGPSWRLITRILRAAHDIYNGYSTRLGAQDEDSSKS